MRYIFFLITLVIGLWNWGWTDTLTICDAGGRQVEPHIASNGIDYLVVWEDGRNGGFFDIYGRIIKGGTTLLDTFAIYRTPGVSNFFPRAVWNGENYLVIWSYNDWCLYGQFIDSDGNPVDLPFIIAGGEGLKRTLGIASNGDNHLVLWARMGSGFCDIYAHLVSKTGDTLTTRLEITTAADSQSAPNAIAINSKNYLVVWQDMQSGNYDIHGRKLASDGSPIGGEVVICDKGVDERVPSIASAGDTVIVVWEEDDGLLSGDCNIYCNILDTSLNPLCGDSVVSARGDDQREPVVTKSPVLCDRKRFLVSWHDYRNGSKADVYYTEVNSKGSCDKNGIQLTSASNDEWKTDIIGAPGGFLVVWEDRNKLPTDASNICGDAWGCAGGVEETSYPKIETIYATPNPFTTKTVIEFRVQSSELEDLQLQIYDLNGRVVKSFLINSINSINSIVWDGRDENGRRVHPGIYFAKPSDNPHHILKLIKL